MTENTKQPQDKRGLRYYTEKKVVSYKERNQQKGKMTKLSSTSELAAHTLITE